MVQSQERAPGGEPQDKVAAVCASLRAAMLAAGRRRYLGPILTSHARQGDLEAALAIVQQLKEEELAASHAQRQQHASPTAMAREAATANGDHRHENGHAGGDAVAANGPAVRKGVDPAADAADTAQTEDVPLDAADGQDDGSDVPDGHKSWSAEDGLRHLLLYSDVDKLYRCCIRTQMRNPVTKLFSVHVVTYGLCQSLTG